MTKPEFLGRNSFRFPHSEARLTNRSNRICGTRRTDSFHLGVEQNKVIVIELFHRADDACLVVEEDTL